MELQAAHLQARPKRKPNQNPPRTRTRHSKGSKDPRTEDRAAAALKNRRAATKEDSRRWASLDGGLCQAICLPSLPRFGEDAVSPTTGSSSAEPPGPLRATPPQPLLQPFQDDPNGPDEECPGCSGTVLATDLACAQCGRQRATSPAPDAAEETRPAQDATTSGSSFPAETAPLKTALKHNAGTRRGRVTFAPEALTVEVASFKHHDLWWTPAELTRPRGHSLKAALALDFLRRKTDDAARTATNQQSQTDTPNRSQASLSKDGYGAGLVSDACHHWWHGGTFAPPPYLTAGRPPEEAAQPETGLAAGRPPEEAAQAETGRRRPADETKPKPKPETWPRQRQEARRPPAEEELATSSEPISEGERRLRAVRARVLARLQGGVS